MSVAVHVGEGRLVRIDGSNRQLNHLVSAIRLAQHHVLRRQILPSVALAHELVVRPRTPGEDIRLAVVVQVRHLDESRGHAGVAARSVLEKVARHVAPLTLVVLVQEVEFGRRIGPLVRVAAIRVDALVEGAVGDCGVVRSVLHEVCEGNRAVAVGSREPRRKSLIAKAFRQKAPMRQRAWAVEGTGAPGCRNAWGGRKLKQPQVLPANAAALAAAVATGGAAPAGLCP